MFLNNKIALNIFLLFSLKINLSSISRDFEYQNIDVKKVPYPRRSIIEVVLFSSSSKLITFFNSPVNMSQSLNSHYFCKIDLILFSGTIL